MVLTVENIVLIGSVLLFVSIIAGKTGFRFGVPTLVLFLGVGMLFGSDGLGIVHFSNPWITQLIGVIALSVILFSGGMDTKFSDIKPVILRGSILATLGVLLTAFFTGFFIYWLTNNFFSAVTFSFLEALLLASVMASTDSASVFSILGSKGLVLRERLKPLLEFESGSNDPMAYLLTIACMQLIQNGEGSVGAVIGNFFFQLLFGAFMGFLLGRLAVRIINKINLNNDSIYPVFLLSLVFIIFSLTAYLNGNGYLAVYISGLVVGNAKFVHKHTTKGFFDGLTWLFQIIMFLALGLLVNPKDLLPIMGVGLAISFFMIIFSRPLSVFLCLLPFRKMSKKAKTYVSWVGLRGAVPIIFATYPLTAGIEKAQMIFNIVFFVTLVSLLVQGTTVSGVARLLGLVGGRKSQAKISEFETVLDEIKSTMAEIIVEQEMLNNGNRLMDMSIPEKTLVVMVKRDGRYFVPTGSTKLDINDILLLISDNERTLKETQKKLHVNEGDVKNKTSKLDTFLRKWL